MARTKAEALKRPAPAPAPGQRNAKAQKPPAQQAASPATSEAASTANSSASSAPSTAPVAARYTSFYARLTAVRKAVEAQLGDNIDVAYLAALLDDPFDFGDMVQEEVEAEAATCEGQWDANVSNENGDDDDCSDGDAEPWFRDAEGYELADAVVNEIDLGPDDFAELIECTRRARKAKERLARVLAYRIAMRHMQDDDDDAS